MTKKKKELLPGFQTHQTCTWLTAFLLISNKGSRHNSRVIGSFCSFPVAALSYSPKILNEQDSYKAARARAHGSCGRMPGVRRVPVGTEYKCSLYHKPPDRHPRVAMAKLLSERERPAGCAVASARASLPHTAFVAPAMLLPGLFGRTRLGLNRIPLPDPGRSAADRSRFLIHFSSRPPPTMAL